MVSKQKHQSIVDVLKDENGHSSVSKIVRDVLGVSESTHEVENLLDAPISESYPEGEQEVNITLRNVDDEPFFAVCFSIFE